MWAPELADFATRIVQIQLEWLRAAGPVSAGLGAALALLVSAAIGRLVWSARRATD